MRFAHLLLAVIMLVVGVSIPDAWLVIPAFVGSLLACEGIGRRPLTGLAALLVVGEASFGWDLGMLSLPTLAVAAGIGSASHVFTMAPWAGQEGWRPGDMVRSFVIACACAASLVALSVLVGAMYGHSALAARLASLFEPRSIWPIAPLCAVFLIVLRRMDIPFRKPIRFGI